MPFPGINYQKEVPHKHAVKAHSTDEALELFAVHTTRDGIQVGRLDAYPVFLETSDIIFEHKFI
jgi:hypothetical protein